MARKSLPLAIAFALTGFTTLTAYAQDTSQANSKEENQPENTSELETLIVTGTRRQDRTVAESLAPIDVMQSEELENAGTPELQSILSRFVPSFNFPRTAITDASDHVRPAQLRGLAPDQTLVLINGKRRHRTAIINVNGTVGRGSSPVDLNTIPMAAIDHIEVLRDGASAQYGSDAIAGVINVVLKDSNSGGSADARYGEYDAGDGRLGQLAANAGFPLGSNGYLNITAEIRDKDPTNRARPDLRQQYPLINGQPDPREATFDRINHQFGDATTRDGLIFLNGNIPVNESMELYAFANGSTRSGESAGFFRRALDARNVPAIYPDGFLPMIQSNVDDHSLVAGLRGTTASSWSWDASFNLGSSEFDFTIDNSVNTSIGATSPTHFYAGSLEAGQAAFNFDMQKAFDVGFLSSPLSSAFGVEYRRETFEIGTGEPDSYFGTGSQVFPGFRPTDAGKHARQNYSLYADFEGDVTERLTLGTAARYEDYSDFGSTISGKFSARYAFTPRYALRGTLTSGFRAPNLQQQYYSTTATNFINGQPFDIRTFPVNNPIAIALGAEPLKAEKSTSYSLGFVTEPIDNLSYTLDFYRIDIDNRIILSENLTGTPVRAFLGTQGFPGTDGGRYFTNAVDTRTQGFDFVARHQLNFGDKGKLVNTLSYNRNKTTVEHVAPNPPELSAANLNLQRIGRVEIGRITVGPPKNKLIWSSDYSIGNFSSQLTATRYGEWALLNANPLLDESFKADWIFDLALNYHCGPTTFTLGAENLTDKMPPELKQDIVFNSLGFASSGPLDNSFTGILPYARGEAPYGFNGRFYYAKFNFQW